MSINKVCENFVTYGNETPDHTLLQILGFRVKAGVTLEEFMGSPLTGREAARMGAFRLLATRLNRKLGETITSPRAAGTYLLSRVAGWDAERFGLLALNARGALLADRILSMGTATGTLISPREVFREALKFGATSIIVYHNHPSGDPAPSREDGDLTKRLRITGESLGVPLSDHLIIGRDTWYSFRAAEGWDAHR